MPYAEGSLGAMLQGISQQPTRIRVDGQVTDQLNYDSDVTEGLTSRPGTDYIFTTDQPDLRYADFDFRGNTYVVAYTPSSMALYRVDDDGGTTELNVTLYTNGSYLGDDMIFYPSEAEDFVFVVNRDKEVAQSTSVAGRPFNAGLVTCLGGQFDYDYTVTIVVPEGTISATVRTPDGDTNTERGALMSSWIMGRMYAELIEQLNANPIAGMVFYLQDDVIAINHTSPMTITTDDGEYGQSLRSAAESVKDVEDLPRYAQHGHVVKVLGATSADDDYFLRFESETTSTDGAGFGSEGTWRESFDPDEAHNWLLTSMPHKLDIEGDDCWLRHVEWLPRRVGDTKSNPTPSFLGSAIRDITGFENRLVVVAGSRPVMTRSDELLDFYKKSATVEADDDPIDFTSTAAGGNTIDWLVPFDKNLLLVADPGKAQFVITGGGITPSNASMVLTTKFETTSGVRPASTGRTVMLGFKAGDYAGVNEFLTEGAANLQNAEPLTTAQNRLMQGTINGALASENFSRVLFTLTGTEDVFVYKYLWTDQERVQSSWSRLNFGGRVQHMFVRDSGLFLMVTVDPLRGDDLLRMDLNRTDTSVAGYHVTLDSKRELTVTNGTVRHPSAEAVIIQGEGCELEGQYLPFDKVDGISDSEFFVDATQAPDGATVHIGVPVVRSVTPTMPTYKDYKDRVVTNVRLTIAAFLVHLGRGSDLRATKTSPYREDAEFYPRRYPMDDNPLDPDRVGTSAYTFRVPWREDTARSELTLTSVDARPDTILEIEWTGQVSGARRRI